jgi:hypothetical protein
MKNYRRKIGIALGLLSLAVMVSMSYAGSTHVAKTSRTEVPEPDAVLAQPSIQETDNTTVSSTKIHLALILDTSNSMDGLIDQAKAQLWNIVGELAKAKYDTSNVDIEIALYEYGNDGLSLSSNYIRQVLPFSTDLDVLSEKLFSLRTNGGSEYCGAVIHEALNALPWPQTDSSLNIIYIAGNEPFDQGGISYREACAEAKMKHVAVNSIYCGNYNEGTTSGWSNGASLAGGLYFNIDSDQKTVFVSTPFDDQINQLNVDLNNTYIYYGKQGASSKENQVRQDKNSETYSTANTAKRAISKSSKMYKNDHWDLVDAYEKDKTVVKTVDKSTLPPDLKNKSDVEIEVALRTKTDERTKIKIEITELANKREEYLVNQSDSTNQNNENTLGDKIIVSVRQQAKTKGYVFE